MSRGIGQAHLLRLYWPSLTTTLTTTFLPTATIMTHDLSRPATGIRPGLLSVLRQMVGLRLVLILTGLLMVWLRMLLHPDRAIVMPAGINALITFIVTDALLLVVIIFVPQSQRVLGRWFLPLALGWLLAAPIIQNAWLSMLFSGASPSRFEPPQVGSVTIEAIWLVVPVVLAAWQYGRRGLYMALAGLALGQLLLLIFIPAVDLDRQMYALSAVGRLGMTTLLGYIMLRLMTIVQEEEDALRRANQQLAQRAATMEQLAESRERNRLARELHDTLAHSLTGISVQLQAVETLLHADPAAAAVQLKDAQSTARSGIQEARRAIQALRATPLEDLGLSEALRQLCRRYAERMEIEITCDIVQTGTLDPLTEQAVYRVAEAALANVERHAAATHAWVNLVAASDNRLRLTVRDNGIGFDLSSVSADRFGLTGMAEWARLAAADLSIESAPNAGTVVVLELRP